MRTAIAGAAAVCALCGCGGATGVAVAEPLDYGVVETTRVPVPPQAQTCSVPEPQPGAQRVTFSRGDSPSIQILAPDSWSSAVAEDGSAMTLTGPGGAIGLITVTPTDLAAAEAFERYADEAQDKAPISSLSILPAELCGYSGQELLGMWSGDGDAPVRYADRLIHVWTDGPSYLVAVHIQSPRDAPGFSETQALMLGHFGIRLP